MFKAMEDWKINLAMMVGKIMVEGGGMCLLATILVNLVTSVLDVISLRGWEGACTLFQHNFLIGPMTLL